MKKIIKSSFLWFAAILLVFSTGLQTTFAATSEVWHDFGSQTTTDVNKPWSVKFNAEVDSTSVDEETIYVMGENNKQVPIHTEFNGDIIKVTPVTSYTVGEKYSLYIEPSIKSLDGTALKTGVKFNFTVKVTPIAAQLEKPIIYPSNSVPVGYDKDDFNLTVQLTGETSALAVYDEVLEKSSLLLYLLNQEGAWKEIGSLFDSGNVKKHGDKIRGDGYYSINLNAKVDVSKISTAQLKVDAKMKDGTTLTTSTALEIVKASTEVEQPVLKLGAPIIFPSNNVPIGYTDEKLRLVVNSSFDASDLAVYNVADEKSSFKLFALNSTNEWTEIGSLFDSGNLDKHSDEIAGDGNFSINLSHIDTSKAAVMKLQVKAELKDGSVLTAPATFNIVATSNGANVTKMLDVFTATENVVASHFNEKEDINVAELEDFILQSLDSDPTVQTVNAISEGILELTYESGLTSMIQIFEETEEEGTDIRSLATRVEATPSIISERRNALPKVPVSQQTVGDSIDFIVPNTDDRFSAAVSQPTPNLIGSRNVLLWAPFADEFRPWNEEEKLSAIFNASPAGFNVVMKTGTDADIDSLKNMTDYGFILLSTHGAAGKWVLTGEGSVDPKKYETEQVLDQIRISQNYIITKKNGVKVKAPAYSVNEKWFDAHINGTFNNAVIFNSSCDSTKTNALWDVFSSKGAGAYYGFNSTVTSKFATEKAVEVTEKLVNQGTTTGNAFVPGTDPYNKYKSEIQLKGNNLLEYANETEALSNLLNGNFESQLNGWQVEGDGRAISGIGNPRTVIPTEGHGMGVISTGLGYTTTLGSIQQTFYLNPNASTLSFDWNYMSEEFLEFIGTGYNDPFAVTLTPKNGKEESVLYLTVNDIAAQFGATNAFPQTDEFYDEDFLPDENYFQMGGKLIPVSPMINFDMGDVWMTDWQKNEYIIPNHLKGQTVTLTFTAVDAQDTIFDTAVLLDNIVIK